MSLPQAWPRPTKPRPVVFIGAGAIVENAHIPAYQRLEFPLRGAFDLNQEAAKKLATAAGMQTYGSLEEACAEKDVVFDVAVPAKAVPAVIEKIPRGAPVLIQKPLGSNLDMAKKIVRLCEERELVAAQNFQLRFSPNMLALAQLVEDGSLGEIGDIEVRVNTYTPWHLWDFLKGIPRHEILYHSIHYLDLLRKLMGDPQGVQCRVARRSTLADYADVGSSIILDYGSTVRCSLIQNHCHNHGGFRAMSEIKIEGSEASAIATMGVNLDYPHGEADRLLVAQSGSNAWDETKLRGSWFTEAFEGPMSNLQRFVAGEDEELISPVQDSVKTMALVEACYLSSEQPAFPIPPVG